MKKVLNSFVAIVILTTAALAANVENPLYAPAQWVFYSKTGFSSMYKQSDANLAMKAKDWENEQEFPIWRIYEDLGFGLTDRFALRGAFGYTHDGAIGRSGPHNARLGLNYRAINEPAEAVVWDIYMDSWLGGISKMRANLIASSEKTPNYPLTFKYENYANGRWGMWFGTVLGRTFDKVTVSVFGEYQITFGNNNNQIKIDESAKPIIGQLVQQGVVNKAIAGVCAAMSIKSEDCNKNNPAYNAIQNAAMQALAAQGINPALVAGAYVAGLPKDFNVDTKGTSDYVAGLKTLYEINKDWSFGYGFTWRYRAANSVEALNITNSTTNLTEAQVNDITKGVADNFVGSMEDGVKEFTLTLLGSRKFTENLQLTLFGEYTYDIAEEKAQLGSDIRAEVGLRLSWQF